MAERKIAPLVPPRLTRGTGHQRLASRNAQLDVVDLLARPRAGSLVYGMGKVDERGAVSNRAAVDALGWSTGDNLHVALLGGSVVAHRDEAGAFAMGPKPYLVIPAAVRYRAGMRARDLVLVVADPHHDVLVVHPLVALDTMITSYHASLTTVGTSDGHRAGGER